MKETMSVENYNFISYLKIIDLSILNLLDYSDFIDNSNFYEEQNDKIVVNFNPQNKKVLEGFIINNINNEVSYGKTNIILNTCSPIKNWRQYERKAPIRKNKYIVIDDSIYIDEIKLNSFTNSVFEKLPIMQATLLKKTPHSNLISSNVEINIGKKIKFLEFNEIDIVDAYRILTLLLSPLGSLTINQFNYNIIKDGNYEYSHSSEISQDIIDNVRIQLIEKEII